MHRRSFKDYFGRDRKTLYIILGIVMISVFTLTVVYATLSTTLNINGNAEVSSASWDIHLDNVQLNSRSATTGVPSITSGTTATFSTTLSKPGDFYEFTIDVVNDGSIDAMIDGVTKTPTLTETQAKYLNYIVEYQNGEPINNKQLVEKKSFVRLKVKLEFRKDITASDLPTTSETLNLAFTVNYVQSDDTGSNVTNNGVEKVVKLVSGNLDTIGSEICIKEECFYVISTTTDAVTMLSKYNLFVGGEDVDLKTEWIAYGDEATGMQDSMMVGSASSYPYKGTTPFSSAEQKGTNYSDYNGSIVEIYVNNYKNLLETNFGVDVMDARLITLEELEALGCNYEVYSCSSSSYRWIYSTSYWSQTANGNNYIWYVAGWDFFSHNFYDYDDGDFEYGVRPVIVISKSLF